MRRRIFIAINLPEFVKKRLGEFKEKWGEIPARWTKEDSLHLTLVFIGYADEDRVYEICKLVRVIARKHEPFSLEFERILYGPPGKSPRMIWLRGKSCREAAALKSELENAFMSLAGLGSFRSETRPFSPHITLARLGASQRYNLPSIDQNFKAVVEVASIEVMESDLKYDGAEYVILESAPLGA